MDRLQSEWRPIMEKHTSQGHWDVMTLVRALQVLMVRAALGKNLNQYWARAPLSLAN